MFFSSSLFINYSHLHRVCRSTSPLHVCPRSSKPALLGSVPPSSLPPGVAGPQSPAGRWVLRAWACWDQGLNIPLKMRKRFTARSHESVSRSLKLLSWWLLLSWGRDYFISSCSCLSLPLFLLLLFPSLTFSDLLGDLLALALLRQSFPIQPFQSTPNPLFTTTPQSPLSASSAAPRSVFFLLLRFPISPLFYPSST